ncbi:MAG: transporter, partial [Nocardioides sp.]|nr:transporter [Nocardioides sp.]
KASTSRLGDLNDRLDRAVAATDLGAEKIPIWAGLVRVLQWLLIITAVVGGLWLALLAFGSYARLPEPPTPDIRGFPIPTLMLLGGILLGVLLAMVCRVLVGMTARRRARAADKRLRDAISEVSGEIVVAPVQAELAAYSAMRDGLAIALK